MSEARRREAVERLQELLWLHGDDAPLDEAVACLGVDEDPEGDVDTTLALLDDMARGLWIPADDPLPTRVARVVHHVHTTLDVAGDDETYDAPRNSVLHSVLARRRGLPILVSVVLVEIARRGGVGLHGVGYPGHFLVGVDGASPRVWLDAFHRGEVWSEAELIARLHELEVPATSWSACLEPMALRNLLARITYNLRHAFERRGDADGVARQDRRLHVLLGAEGVGVPR